MRENRTYGSEGGETKAFPTPIKWSRLRDFCKGLAKREKVRASAAYAFLPSVVGYVDAVGLTLAVGED